MTDVKPTETTEVPSSAAPTTESTTIQPVAEVKPETVEAAPVATEAKPEEPAPEALATESATEPVAETPVTAPKEIEPIYDGVLETKIISLLPLFVRKHTFYFSDEAIPEENLGEYLKKEKTKTGYITNAYPTFAHATQTGKGLLFYTKADKTKPTGIVRLDGSEITTQGDKKFTVKSAGHELQLEAATSTLRERWVHTLKLKVTESEGIHAATAETDSFKAVLDKLSKPIYAVSAAKKEEVVEDKKEESEDKTKSDEPAPTPVLEAPEEEPAESSATAAAKTEKKEEKGKRSSSRSRLTNRFSFFGKKEEKEKEEETAAVTVPEVKEETAPTDAPTVAPIEPTTAEVPTVTEPTPIETAPTTEATKPAESPIEAPKDVVEEEPAKADASTSPVTSPKSANRKSFLGGLFGKKAEKKADVGTSEEGAKSPDPVPEVTATTDVQPLTSEAQTTEPLPDASEPKETAVEPPTVTTPEATTPVAKEKDTKAGIFGSLRRDKSSDREDKPKRSLSFWKKDKEKKSSGKEEAAITESEPTEETTAEPVASTSSEPLKTEPVTTEPTQAVVPDADTDVRGGQIGDVVPAAITVGGDSRA
ncbi:hypothetical protein ABW20_dc0109316 [Dactylellina cionopaga]|nr:hypothetical protein ABW20_dc0109316 [Dactylellina cionopaga]